MSNSKPLIESTVFSHGTMDCRDAHKTQRFLQEFLGVRSVRKSEGTQYIWLGGWWIVACLTVGGKVPPRQGDGYRFGLLVETPEEVDAAHAAAVEHQAGCRNRRGAGFLPAGFQRQLVGNLPSSRPSIR